MLAEHAFLLTHAPDTPFLVAEEDWRLYRDRCVADREWVAEVDSCGRAYLLGEDFQIDSRQTLLLLLQCSRNIRKEPESESDRGFLGFVGEEPLPVLGGAAASSSGGAGPPRSVRPGSPAPEAGAPSASQQKPSLCE